MQSYKLKKIEFGDINFSIGKDGRIFNPFTFLKQECRDIILPTHVYKDISNSHPFIFTSLLYLMFFKTNRIIKSKKGIWTYLNNLCDSVNKASNEDKSIIITSMQIINEMFELFKNTKSNLETLNEIGINIEELKLEVKEMYNSVTSGKFYEDVITKHISNKRKFNNLTFIIKDENLDIKKNPKLINDKTYLREIAKISFLYFLNGKNPKIKYPPKQLYIDLYPNISKLIYYLKEKYGYTSIRNLVSLCESILVYKSVHIFYKQRKSAVGTVHDGFYVKKRLENDFIELVKKVSNNLFKSTPNFK